MMPISSETGPFHEITRKKIKPEDMQLFSTGYLIYLPAYELTLLLHFEPIPFPHDLPTSRFASLRHQG